MQDPPTEIPAELIDNALCDILASSVFLSSRQCQLLFRYIVDFSLTGQDELLRERVIGATVFGRAPDYDTGNDPIVRARAAEVRKRLAQYYVERQDKAAVQISIPKGSYRAVFSYGPPSKEWSDVVTESSPTTQDHPQSLSLAVNDSKLATEQEHDRPVRTRHPLKSWRAFTGLLLFLAIPCGWLMFRSWHNQRSENRFKQFWAPFSNSTKPAIIYIGANSAYRLSRSYLENYRREHHIQNAGLDFFIDLKPSESISEADLVPTNKLIGFGDVAAAARITSTLASLGKNYDLRYGNDITITDMQSSPVVLIGGFSNAWAMQITRHLRYTLDDIDKVVDNNDKSKVWQRTDDDETNKPQDDYAILSRLVHSQTGGFVLSIAGVGSSSNQATTDFISDPRQIDKLLQNAPPGWQNMNMQVVLHTTTIDDIPTSVDVKAIYFW